MPITPSCCGDSDVSSMTPAGREPDANDKRSENATTDPPGDIDRADAFEPAKEMISAEGETHWMSDQNG